MKSLINRHVSTVTHYTTKRSKININNSEFNFCSWRGLTDFNGLPLECGE